MFLQAGINPHGRRLCIYAFTLPANRSFGSSYRVTACELYRFRSGDTAWIPTHRRWIAWPHQVEFFEARGFNRYKVPRLPWEERLVCMLDTREERQVL